MSKRKLGKEFMFFGTRKKRMKDFDLIKIKSLAKEKIFSLTNI